MAVNSLKKGTVAQMSADLANKNKAILNSLKANPDIKITPTNNDLQLKKVAVIEAPAVTPIVKQEPKKVQSDVIVPKTPAPSVTPAVKALPNQNQSDVITANPIIKKVADISPPFGQSVKVPDPPKVQSDVIQLPGAQVSPISSLVPSNIGTSLKTIQEGVNPVLDSLKTVVSGLSKNYQSDVMPIGTKVPTTNQGAPKAEATESKLSLVWILVGALVLGIIIYLIFKGND